MVNGLRQPILTLAPILSYREAFRLMLVLEQCDRILSCAVGSCGMPPSRDDAF